MKGNGCLGSEVGGRSSFYLSLKTERERERETMCVCDGSSLPKYKMPAQTLWGLGWGAVTLEFET